MRRDNHATGALERKSNPSARMMASGACIALLAFAGVIGYRLHTQSSLIDGWQLPAQEQSLFPLGFVNGVTPDGASGWSEEREHEDIEAKAWPWNLDWLPFTDGMDRLREAMKVPDQDELPSKPTLIFDENGGSRMWSAELDE